MADSSEIRVWIHFFTEAGIPSTSAADYALTFSENRIQKNMLLDLNKEYLKEMGITLMGDVIAILRHARTVHDQVAREKVLYPNIDTVMPTRRVPEEEEEASQVKKTGSAVTRILDHYTRNSGTSPVNKMPRTSEKLGLRTIPNKVPEKKMRIVAPLKRKSGTSRSDEMEEEEELSPVQNSPTSIVRTATPTVTSSDSSVVVKKARRVLPEHEGGYTVKLPAGNTPRSKEILEKYKVIQEQKAKTVFERLGNDSSVTSTTQPERDVAFKVTFQRDTILRSNCSEKPSTNVFKRLGNKIVKSSIPKTQPDSQPLPYNGILKKTAKNSSEAKKILKKKPGNLITMRADEPKVPIKDRAALISKARTKKTSIIVKKNMKSTVTTGTEGILGKFHSQKVSVKTSVKDRLGSSSGSTDKSVDKTVSLVGNATLKNDEPLDFEAEEEESFVSAKEECTSTPTPKKVTFGKIQEKFIPGMPKRIPSNIGSIVLGTGFFKRN